MKDNVTFTEENHKYQGRSGREFISTTTLISRYKEPFDSEYWSKYKAIERLVIAGSGINFFNETKKKIGYENIIPYFLPKIKKDGRLENTINEILNEWEKKKKEALEKGTAYHKEKEKEVNSQEVCEETKLKVILLEERLPLLDLADGVYTELVVWNEEYGVAGQADKVILQGDEIAIDDYKTSKVINEKSFKHYETGYKMMKKPVNNLMDCNFYHYALQLSVYGWMLEQVKRKVRRLRIYHSVADVYITVPYLKKEVELLMKDYEQSK